ncbi:hypothetical protein [Actinomadura latina]|uniref:hypothetical protein n=1 Tax=Actinomadura latina TaxID=163603 RepID=UPI000829B87A|nr:hypothetical protein [Actinomadura latina]
MDGLLRDKAVLVSGVGPGLGRTTALRCARAGADVVLAARAVDAFGRLDALVNNATAGILCRSETWFML